MKGSFEQLKLAIKPMGELRYGGPQALKVNCPNCENNGGPADKFNLEVSYSLGIFHCWACNIKGGLSRLIKLYGYKEYATWFEADHIPKEEKESTVFELPQTVPVYLNEKAYTYLKEQRGITLDIIKQKDIRYCYIGSYNDNIIFPSYDEYGQLNYYCAHNYNKGKYTERKGNKFTCFYENQIDKNIPIILTEGVYDALSVPNCIPLLGLKIRKELLDFIADRHIILALDSVVEQKAKDKVAKQLLTTCKTLEILNLGQYKDLNEAFVKDANWLKSKLLPYYEA